MNMRNAFELMNEYNEVVKLREDAYEAQVGKSDAETTKQVLCDCRIHLERYLRLIEQTMKFIPSVKVEGEEE